MTKRVKIKPLYVHSVSDLYMYPREYKNAISRIIKMYPTRYADFTPREISRFAEVLRAVYVALDCGDMPRYCDHYLYECRLYSDVAARDLGAYFRQNDRKRFDDFGARATLQGLADYILKYHGDDVKLLELAGVPEFPDEDDPREVAVYLDQLTA